MPICRWCRSRREPRHERAHDPRQAIRRFNILGLLVLVVLFGGAGGWAATSQLSGAVIAPGQIVVESNVKKVQHPTGGIVGELYVREGAKVEQGQILLRLDETVARATLGIVQSQIDELTAREARLDAERNDLVVLLYPDTFLARKFETTVAAALADERQAVPVAPLRPHRPAIAAQRAHCADQGGNPRPGCPA